MLEHVYGEGILRAFAAWADRPLWLMAWRSVSFLGSPTFLTAAVPLLYALATRARANRFAASFLASTLVSEILKAAIARPRLDTAQFGLPGPLEHEREFDSASFPSGHVLTATVVWGAIALRVRPAWARALCWSVVPLMAASRLALLRHDLLDVVAGAAVGALLLVGLLTFERTLQPRLAPLPWVEQAGLWTLGAVAVAAAWPLRAVAVTAGVLAGLMSASAWGQARGLAFPRKPSARAVLAASLGLAGAAAARAIGQRWLAGGGSWGTAGAFALYSAAGIWIAGVVPALLTPRRGA